MVFAVTLDAIGELIGHRQGQRVRAWLSERVTGLTDSSAATAALSNSASRLGLAPLRPATTSRAHRICSSRRLADQSGGGLAVGPDIARFVGEADLLGRSFCSRAVGASSWRVARWLGWFSSIKVAWLN